MGYLSKDDYERKQRYVDNKNRDNAEIVKDYFIYKYGEIEVDEDGYEELVNENEIDNMTEELTMAIESICTARHEMHSGEAKDVVSGEIDTPGIDYFYDDNCQAELDTIEKYLNIKPFKTFDYADFYIIYDESYDELYDYLPKDAQEELDEESLELFNKEYKELTGDETYPGFYTLDKFTLLYNKYVELNTEIVENKNTEIEQYLSQIDEILGTNYCPTGIARMRW